MSTNTYLDLCTCHIKSETMAMLEHWTGHDRMSAGWPAMTLAPYEFGVFVTVPDIDLPEVAAQLYNLPGDLADCLSHACDVGAKLICFDADGNTLHALETYEW